jgi:hypothetical protein
MNASHAYYIENPQALKGYIKTRLPVVWKVNKKGLDNIDSFQ